MEIDAVRTSYRRWARVYDHSFGAVTQTGRRRAVAAINRRAGSVLEVGVGTGLALEFYKPHLDVTGIDYSDEMLAKAQEKVDRQNLSHVKALRQMDARVLDFPDNSFDTIAAMHVLSVVPEPEKVMAEIARVCKPGGEVVISNHFNREEGAVARLERAMAPLSNMLGWHPDFPIETVLGEPDLIEDSRTSLPPFGMMTLLILRKRPV